MAASNVASAARTAAQAADRRAVVAKTATKTAQKVTTAKPKPVSKPGNTSINTEDVAARQRAIQALRADDALYFDMLNKVPTEETPSMTANEPAPWTLEGDAVYRDALAAGKSAFTFAQAQALADKQNQQTAAAQQTKQINTNATEGRRRLAGNYAARGMAGGGSASALGMAEARANAEQVAARTSIADQLTALNNQYLENYGDASVVDPVTGKSTYDWTSTLAGQQYKTQAAQAAIQAQLARYGAV
jgi:hypothetical protein